MEPKTKINGNDCIGNQNRCSNSIGNKNNQTHIALGSVVFAKNVQQFYDVL